MRFCDQSIEAILLTFAKHEFEPFKQNNLLGVDRMQETRKMIEEIRSSGKRYDYPPSWGELPASIREAFQEDKFADRVAAMSAGKHSYIPEILRPYVQGKRTKKNSVIRAFGKNCLKMCEKTVYCTQKSQKVSK